MVAPSPCNRRPVAVQFGRLKSVRRHIVSPRSPDSSRRRMLDRTSNGRAVHQSHPDRCPTSGAGRAGGGHGGVNATFEPDSLQESAFSKDYWKNTVVAPLAAKGVKADLIVLDACLTASMIDAFAPLCSARGKIIASMYSINQKVMTPEIWAEVLGKASVERPAIIERRAQEVVRNADQASRRRIVQQDQERTVR